MSLGEVQGHKNKNVSVLFVGVLHLITKRSGLLL